MGNKKEVDFSFMCGKCGQLLPDSRRESPCFCGNNHPHKIIRDEEDQKFQCHCGNKVKSLSEAKKICRSCYVMNSFKYVSQEEALLSS